jgi:hypothetical protein
LLQHKTLASDLVPDCIVPKIVRIRQKRVFLKDGWTYTLCKKWQGSGIMDCEVQVLTKPPQCSLSVSLVSQQAAQAFPSLHVHETLVAKLAACL